MATIDNLNFAVILDDADFNKKIKADIQLAEKFNVSLSDLLTAKARLKQTDSGANTDAASFGKAAKSASDMSKAVAAAAKAMAALMTAGRSASSLDSAAKSLERMATAARKVNGSFNININTAGITKAANTFAKAASGFSSLSRVSSTYKSHATTFNNEATALDRLTKSLRQAATMFNQVQRAAAKANTAMRTSPAMVSRLSQTLAAASAQARNLTANMGQLATTQTQVVSGASAAGRQMGKLNGVFVELAKYALSYFSIRAVSGFVSQLVRVTGEFETQQVALRSIVGNLTEADMIYDKIKAFSVKSPFEFKDLAAYTKQLAAFSFPANELFDTMKMLADVSAGLGVSMDRIILAYGQVRSAAYLRGQEVRQFTEAGIPILEELQKQIKETEGKLVSIGDVFNRISSRQIPFEMVEQAFRNMTSEGGKFYNMQEVLAGTLQGKISNLRDAYNLMLSEIGNDNKGLLTGAVDGITGLMQNYEKVIGTLKTFAITFGTVRAALMLYQLSTNAASLATSALGKAVRALYAVIKQNPYTAIAVAVAALAGYIYTAVQNTDLWKKAQKDLNSQFDEFTMSMTSEKAMLDYLFDRLKKAKTGTEEYAETKKRILIQFRDYTDGLVQEKLAADDLAGSYGRLKENIEAAGKAKFRQQGANTIQKAYEGRNEEIMEAAFNPTGGVKRKFSTTLTTIIKDYIAGNIQSLQGLDVPDIRKEMEQYAKPALLGLGQSGWKALKTQQDPFGQYFETMFNTYRTMWAENIETFNSRMAQLDKLYEGYKVETPAPKWEASGWKKVVNDILQGAGYKNKAASGGIMTDEYTDVWSWIEQLRDAYTEAKQQAKALSKELIAADTGTENGLLGVRDSLETKIKVYEEIAKTLGISLSSGSPFTPSGRFSYSTSTKTDTTEKDAIEMRIEALKRLKDAYDRLIKSGMDKKSALSNMGTLFPNTELYGGDFNSAILREADTLAKIDANAAAKVRQSLSSAESKSGVDKLVSDMTESANAGERLAEALNDARSVMNDLQTTGFATRLNSELQKTVKQNAATAAKYGAMRANLSLEEFSYKNSGKEETKPWTEYKAEGLKAIAELEKAEIDANKRVLQERISGLVEQYKKELFDTKGIDMSNLSNQSLQQLANLRTQIAALRANPIDSSLITPELKQRAQELGVSLDVLDNKLKELLSNAATNVNVKWASELKTLIDSVASSLSKLGSTMEGMGGFLGAAGGAFSGIGSALSTVSGMSSFMKDGASIFSKGAEVNGLGGYLGLASTAMSGVMTIVSDIGAQLEENRKIQAAWNQTVRDCAHEYTMLQLEALDYEQSNIFGVENPFQKAIEGGKQYAAAMEDLNGLLGELEENGRVQTGTKKVNNWKSIMKNTGTGAGAGAAAGAIVGGIVGPIGTAVAAGVGAVVGAVGGFFAGLFGSKKRVAVYDSLTSQYGSILDPDDPESYKLNPKIIADYNKMDEQTKKLIDNWDEIREKAMEAQKQMKDTFEELVGDFGTELSDALVEAFTNGNIYKGIDKFRDYATDAIQDIVVQMAYAKVFQPLLDKLEQGMIGSFGLNGDQTIVDDLLAFMKEYPQYVGLFGDVLSQIQETFKNAGYDFFKPETGDSLSSGIESITEDTASLLASYINAMRADVSFMRMQESQWHPVIMQLPQLLGGLASLPTAADNIALIEAHTANTAMNTATILSKFKSVITTESGRTSISVYM